MNIWEYIGNKIGSFDTENVSVLWRIPEFLLPACANILSEKLSKRVEIDIYDNFDASIFEKVLEIHLKKGYKFDSTILSKIGFTKVSRVWNENEYSVLGDVVVLWPEGESGVIRVSFFDGVVEELTLLDSQTRRLLRRLDIYTLTKKGENVRSRVYSGKEDWDKVRFVYLRNESNLDDIDYPKLDLGIRAFPGTDSNQVEQIVKSYLSQGFEVFTPNETLNYISGLKRCSQEILRGFVVPSIKVAVITEFEFLGKINLGGGSKKGDEIFKEISQGDYIVHQDHGIGIYKQLIYLDGKSYLEVHYAGKDRLLIPLSAASKITKYVGAGKKHPTLTGLNSGVWTRIKGKATEDIEKLAKELIRLYAMRSLAHRRPFINDQRDIEVFNKFVSEFKHSDTEDQEVITRDILTDLSTSRPMDRLIVGDVGFGKTELAARAAFLVANANKQVVLLAPTTILSLQHYTVLKERFEKYPFKIAILNRYITGREREKTLEDIANKKVDIVVGTHSVLSEGLQIPSLGLLIIDEEQKFGVSQKERLKSSRLEVDVLSITATPIPRTLNMAISGIRDLSILASVPTGRKPIENSFQTYNIDVIKQAILKEVGRGGQVYYLHNRVRDLPTIKEELEKSLPEVTFGIVHGQMGETQVNIVMKDFILNRINVLICSSIIENGLDISNVNTLIVDDAQRYGLSSLYQIRGRVGRSERQAYAYFMYANLKGRANLRLDALYEASNIGSGFVLSNRDLEIRGSGNILGKSQSGAINSIGYALYTQILNSAVSKLQDKNYSSKRP